MGKRNPSTQPKVEHQTGRTLSLSAFMAECHITEMRYAPSRGSNSLLVTTEDGYNYFVPCSARAAAVLAGSSQEKLCVGVAIDANGKEILSCKQDGTPDKGFQGMQPKLFVLKVVGNSPYTETLKVVAE